MKYKNIPVDDNKFLYLFPDLSDYTAINRSLVFNGATRSHMVTVTIRDDMAVEDQFEQFFINLRNYWYESAVILDGSTASVTIEDNDSELSLQYIKNCMCTRMSIYHNMFSTSVVTIGFNGTYSVREDAGSISIVVLVLMNSLAKDVVVTLSTMDNTARGRFAQCLNLHGALLTTYLYSYPCSWNGLHSCV